MYILSLIVYTEHFVTIPYTLYSVSIGRKRSGGSMSGTLSDLSIIIIIT